MDTKLKATLESEIAKVLKAVHAVGPGALFDDGYGLDDNNHPWTSDLMSDAIAKYAPVLEEILWKPSTEGIGLKQERQAIQLFHDMWQKYVEEVGDTPE